MSFELEGKLIVKGETQQVSDKFKKREFVVEKTQTAGENTYTETIKFQLVQDKCDTLDYVQEGDEILVKFNIKGNKWEKNGKTSYFVNLDAWRIEKQGVDNTSHQEIPQAQAADNQDDNDLPF